MTSSNQNQKAAKLKVFLRKAVDYLIAYLLFAVTMVALIFLLFRIRLDTILIADVLGYEVWEIRGIVNITILIVGLLMLVVVGYGEDRLRKSIEENRMWKTLLLIYIATAAAWIFELIVYQVAVWIIYA